MKFQEFPIPANLNGAQLKAELGCDEVYIRGDKLVIGGDLTEAQALAGITAHQITFLAKKAEQDAIDVQFAKDKASAEAKLISYGLSLAEIKANRGEKKQVL